MSSIKLSAFVTLLLASVSIAFDYDEAIDGDLPYWGEIPLDLGVATVGENVVHGTTQPTDTARTDFFSFQIPEGLVLTSIEPTCDGDGDDFVWRLWRGNTARHDYFGCTEEDFLGERWGEPPAVPGCGFDILPDIAETCGKFTPPLGPGVYTFAAGEAASIFPYTLTFTFSFGDTNIPAASEWGLVVLALGALTAGTLTFRRRQPLASPNY